MPIASCGPPFEHFTEPARNRDESSGMNSNTTIRIAPRIKGMNSLKGRSSSSSVSITAQPRMGPATEPIPPITPYMSMVNDAPSVKSQGLQYVK